MDEVKFRPLEKRDLRMLHEWLNQPHMRSYYQREYITFEEVVFKYSPRIEGTKPIFCHLALIEQRPFGKIQCYKNTDWPTVEIELLDGLSIDYFIGDPSFLKRGLAVKMVSTYVNDIVFKLFKDESKCYVSHDKTNHAAIKCTELAGFQFLRNVTVEDIPHCLYQKSKF